MKIGFDYSLFSGSWFIVGGCHLTNIDSHEDFFPGYWWFRLGFSLGVRLGLRLGFRLGVRLGVRLDLKR